MRKTGTGFAVASLALALMVAGSVGASDEPDELLGGVRFIISRHSTDLTRARVVFRCKNSPTTLPGVNNDPVTEGATLRILDLGLAGGDDDYDLPAGANWQPNAMGYRYTDANFANGPCQLVRVQSNGISGRCKGIDMTLMPPFAGPAGVVLRVGSDTKRYCCTFGGSTRRNEAGKLVRRDAPPPSVCAASPSGAFLDEAAVALF